MITAFLPPRGDPAASAPLPPLAGGPLGPHELVIPVRFAEVDALRVVHHSRYWMWFEEGRFNFMRNVLEISTDEIEAVGSYTPLISATIKYGRAVRWRDTVRVSVRMETFQGAKVAFHYTAVDANDPGVLFATATSVHVFTDLELKLKLTVPDVYRDKFARAVEQNPHLFRIPLPATPRR